MTYVLDQVAGAVQDTRKDAAEQLEIRLHAILREAFLDLDPGIQEMAKIHGTSPGQEYAKVLDGAVSSFMEHLGTPTSILREENEAPTKEPRKGTRPRRIGARGRRTRTRTAGGKPAARLGKSAGIKRRNGQPLGRGEAEEMVAEWIKACEPGQTFTPSMICDALDMNSSTVTDVLVRLHNKSRGQLLRKTDNFVKSAHDTRVAGRGEREWIRSGKVTVTEEGPSMRRDTPAIVFHALMATVEESEDKRATPQEVAKTLRDVGSNIGYQFVVSLLHQMSNGYFNDPTGVTFGRVQKDHVKGQIYFKLRPIKLDLGTGMGPTKGEQAALASGDVAVRATTQSPREDFDGELPAVE